MMINFVLVDCKWGSWHPWSDCSVTCGNGITTRKRSKTVPQIDSRKCIGKSTEESACNPGRCPG